MPRALSSKLNLAYAKLLSLFKCFFYSKFLFSNIKKKSLSLFQLRSLFLLVIWNRPFWPFRHIAQHWQVCHDSMLMQRARHFLLSQAQTLCTLRNFSLGQIIFTAKICMYKFIPKCYFPNDWSETANLELFVLFCLFETGSYYVVLAGLEPMLQTRLAQTQRSGCLCWDLKMWATAPALELF